MEAAADPIEALHIARAKMKAANHGIGEPCVQLDPRKVSVVRGETPQLYMTMADLIEMVSRVLVAE